LSYQEADKLSRQNKEFIQQLFPPGEIYATLFTQKIQDSIGEVGPETEGARAMLVKIGFRYDERIDPFDGGPHYSAPTGEIEPIERFRRGRLAAAALPDDAELQPGVVEERLVSVERSEGRSRFRAVRTPCRFMDASIALPAEARELLNAEPGDRLNTIPFD
jgi:arginine N-succinyltransferase